MLPAAGWVTARAKAAAPPASTPVPPSMSTSTPTSGAMKFWAATIPVRARPGWLAAERVAARTNTGSMGARRNLTGVLLPDPGRARLPPSRPGAETPGGDTLPAGGEPVLMIALGLAAGVAAPAAQPRTLRLDYVHSGGAAEERFALDGWVREGSWPGRPDRAIDDTNLGPYFFEVVDRAQNRVLYSRGFASIFGEWETTSEAKDIARAFHESLRFPEPAAPVQVVVKKRGRNGAFREVWSLLLDPKSPAIDSSPSSPGAKVWAVMKNGEPRDKVDLLLMGDGYTTAEMEKWHRDARRMADLLFAASPFKERRQDFNVWAVV